jgi:uncharacterized protein (DUF2267 family)
MTDRDFLERVRRRVRLESARDAEVAALAVLRLVAGRLSWREQRDLAAHLPDRLRRRVRDAANTDLGYAPASAFLRDLSEELLVSPRRAAEIAAAVGEVVAEVMPADELRDLKAELHGTYDVVFKDITAA